MLVSSAAPIKPLSDGHMMQPSITQHARHSRLLWLNTGPNQRRCQLLSCKGLSVQMNSDKHRKNMRHSNWSYAYRVVGFVGLIRGLSNVLSNMQIKSKTLLTDRKLSLVWDRNLIHVTYCTGKRKILNNETRNPTLWNAFSLSAGRFD